MATLTMTRGKQLTERVESNAARVDTKGGVLYGVKVLGFKSRNGRTYSRRALEKAASLYEGISVYVNHPRRVGGDDRDLNDKIGWLEGVRMTADGLRGDLHLLLADPRTPKILEAAVRKPSLLGLSHNASGTVSTGLGGQGQVVDAIEHVYSVDLVADPASTSGLFEAVQSASATTTRKQDIEQAAQDIQWASTDAAVAWVRQQIEAVIDGQDPAEKKARLKRDPQAQTTLIARVREVLDVAEQAAQSATTTIAAEPVDESRQPSYEQLLAEARGQRRVPSGGSAYEQLLAEARRSR